MTLKYKCTFGLEEGKKHECDAKAKSRFAWTVRGYCSSIYRHRTQPVANYNYALYKSLQHWLGHTCIKRSFCLYVGLKRRSSMKRDLRPSLRNDFGRSCFFVWDLRRTEARPQQYPSYLYLVLFQILHNLRSNMYDIFYYFIILNLSKVYSTCKLSTSAVHYLMQL
jgi:hypothetical protein